MCMSLTHVPLSVLHDAMKRYSLCLSTSCINVSLKRGTEHSEMFTIDTLPVGQQEEHAVAHCKLKSRG